jgi:dimethylargininase
VSGAAIVCPPCATFARGLTTSRQGPPDLDRARSQHRAYVEALERCGMRVIALPPDDEHPDSTFVEDTAVLARGIAVVTRPGAASRRGEVVVARRALETLMPDVRVIEPPGTMDGGDVCGVGHHFLIGISTRTNEEGARQLAQHLADVGCTWGLVHLEDAPTLLHLKSGLASLGERRVGVVDALLDHPALAEFERIRVDREEMEGANCVRVGDRLLIPAGCPRWAERLSSLGYDLIVLDVSEFQKMDGGLSCLSLRLEDL